MFKETDTQFALDLRNAEYWNNAYLRYLHMHIRDCVDFCVSGVSYPASFIHNINHMKYESPLTNYIKRYNI